jgi:hypothetical protein
MNERAYLLAQAIRGPILLITLGILFAMHQAGTASFARTWPTILIVLGVMKLVERMAAPPTPPYVPPAYPQAYGPRPPAGPGTGGIQP